MQGIGYVFGVINAFECQGIMFFTWNNSNNSKVMKPMVLYASYIWHGKNLKICFVVFVIIHDIHGSQHFNGVEPL